METAANAAATGQGKVMAIFDAAQTASVESLKAANLPVANG